MKEIRFRIIELEDYQVLLKKGYSEEDEKEIFEMSFYDNGVTITTTYGYDTEEERDKWFSEVTEINAKNFVYNILKNIYQ